MTSGDVHHRRATCRVCGGDGLRPVLSLGPMPLANAFLQSPAEFVEEPSYPLDVSFCEGCTFLQLVDVVDPEVLFRHYLYTSGTSDTMSAHHQSLAACAVEALGGLRERGRLLRLARRRTRMLRRRMGKRGRRACRSWRSVSSPATTALRRGCGQREANGAGSSQIDASPSSAPPA